MERVISPQGLLLLLHLHNSLNYNLAPGQPLSPTGWLNIFQHMPVTLLPEKNIVEDFIRSNVLDLTREYSEAALNNSNAIAIIGGRDKSILRIYQDVWSDLLRNRSNLIINPIYTIERKVDSVTLRRKLSSDSFRKEFPFMENYLPEECTINGMIAESLNGRGLDTSSTEFSEQDLLCIEDLMKKFVVINVPQNYC